MDSKNVSLTIVFAVLYVIGVMPLATISFDIYQVRLADALLPLSMIFGVPSAVGLSLGCLVANVYSPFGVIDILGGSVANFIGCTLAWYVAKKSGLMRRFLGTIIETLVITAIVGGYLSFIIPLPLEVSLIGIFVGSLIAINILGFTIEEIIRRSSIVKYGYITEKW